jgi:uncharacterized protein
MRLRSCVLFVVAAALAGLLLVPGAQAQRYDVPPRPDGPVLDRARMLSGGEEAQLARKLTAFTDTTSTAIVVVTLPSLDGAPIAEYAVALGRAWGVGQAGKDNGVVVLVSRGDREVFIATGYGVEGALPDAIVNRIVERIITPAFRQEQFYAGLDRGTDAVIRATKGEFDAEAAARPAADEGLPMALLFTMLVLGFFFVRAFFSGGGGGRGGRRTRRDAGGLPVIIWGGGGGGGGGFSGGGGFGGFGGGSFGGGGAGGSW